MTRTANRRTTATLYRSGFVARALVLLALSSLVSAASFYPAAILLDSNWETGDFRSYGWSTSGNDTGVVVNSKHPVCNGRHSARFSLDFDRDRVPYRTQFTLNKGPLSELQIGNEYWLSFSVYLPDSWSVDMEEAQDVVFDVHARPDKHLGEGYRKGIFSIRTIGDSWAFQYSRDSRQNSGQQGNSRVEEQSEQLIGKWESGKWTTFVLHTKLTWKPEGYVEVWKDGEKVAEKRNGIGYNDDRGPYVKIGIYKSYWGVSKGRDWQKEWGGRSNVSSRTLYIDDVRIGGANASYVRMEPSCRSHNPSLRTSGQKGTKDAA